jgi:hypothetical protein
MFILMRDNRVLCQFPPLCGFRDIDFKMESVVAKKSFQLGRLHSVVIGHRIRECPEEPLFFGASLGNRGHDQIYRSGGEYV